MANATLSPMIDPIFRDVLAQPAMLEILSRAAVHPGNGYLFTGPQGMGKTTLAECFARSLLKQPPELSLESHPDFIRLTREEEKKEIVIKQVRDLMERLALTPARGGRMVVLIEQAERLNEESANALLKIVEEPPAYLTFLLTTSSAERLPVTLRSRLISLPLQPLPNTMILPWLQTHGADQKKAEHIAKQSRGCPGKAFRLLSDSETDNDQHIKDVYNMLATGSIGSISAQLEELAKNLDASADPVTAWQETLRSLMTLSAEQLEHQPERIKQVGEGLLFAWKLVGTSLSPRLGLEWSLVRAYLSLESTPTFLRSSLL